MRWRLDLAYDGANFSGWAAQPGRRTVQRELEQWIPRVLRLDDPVLVICAGRTDAGVHARGQVAHVDLPDRESDLGPTLLRRLDRVLAADLVVRAVSPAPPAFDARFAAIWRRYCYRLWDSSPGPDPLRRGYVARTRCHVDVAAINAAAGHLLGLRDFAAFCRRREGATTIRNLLQLEAVRVSDGPLAGVVEFSVRADAFCHSMVRALVGAAVAVGEGRLEVGDPAALLDAAERTSAFTVMPAKGLTLTEVGYPDDHELEARAGQTRARRELHVKGLIG